MTAVSARSRQESDTPAMDRLELILTQLRRQASNAARRNKPTMWAYLDRMEERLTAWFAPQMDAAISARRGGLSASERRGIDGGIAGAALALVQRAEAQCPVLHRDEAADLWALGTYASRVVAAWSGRSPRRSLKWLRGRMP